MKRWTILTLALALLVSGLPALSQGGSPIAMAGEWLASQQQPDGSFAGEAQTTAIATIALGTLDRDTAAARDWLESNFTEDWDLRTVSWGVIALTVTDSDPGTFADGALLASYTEQFRAARGEDTQALCLGLLARHNLDIPLPETAVGALVSFQQEDGGFSATPDGETDVVTTSLCTQVLSLTDQQEALDNAMAYLGETQLEDDGWSSTGAEASDPLGTAHAMQALISIDEDLGAWGNPERTLVRFMDRETGAFATPADEDETSTLKSTATSILVFEGLSLATLAGSVAEDETSDAAGAGPALDPNWKLVGDGYGIELDTADDFFVTVIDPFDNTTEYYGVEIINWTAEYRYTGYIVEEHLPAEILLWMGEQDPSTWENISNTTLELLPDDVIAQLPDEVQARVTE
ncbi:MAG: terpene cyclase/mutase family protein [Chloroflexi bacterium]|nr:terpene cyclase/mutase family protein [Chloroflexota bacterium]